mmetsp:Transcript_77278/g.222311  ORF Transcript_77278/g.222311 Transcript_77278/m.222311 type:complete len:247 (-) Transcript_77278:1661-2401(-)
MLGLKPRFYLCRCGQLRLPLHSHLGQLSRRLLLSPCLLLQLKVAQMTRFELRRFLLHFMFHFFLLPRRPGHVLFMFPLPFPCLRLFLRSLHLSLLQLSRSLFLLSLCLFGPSPRIFLLLPSHLLLVALPGLLLLSFSPGHLRPLFLSQFLLLQPESLSSSSLYFNGHLSLQLFHLVLLRLELHPSLKFKLTVGHLRLPLPLLPLLPSLLTFHHCFLHQLLSLRNRRTRMCVRRLGGARAGRLRVVQ